MRQWTAATLRTSCMQVRVLSGVPVLVVKWTSRGPAKAESQVRVLVRAPAVVAQLAERPALNRSGAGSLPADGTRNGGRVVMQRVANPYTCKRAEVRSLLVPPRACSIIWECVRFAPGQVRVRVASGPPGELAESGLRRLLRNQEAVTRPGVRIPHSLPARMVLAVARPLGKWQGKVRLLVRAPALVAQWTERRSPKPRVGSSSLSEGPTPADHRLQGEVRIRLPAGLPRGKP